MGRLSHWIVQLGMRTNDAFGTAVLQDSMYTLIITVFLVEQLEVLVNNVPLPGQKILPIPWWFWTIVAILVAKVIISVFLLWAGFICWGKAHFLKLWIIFGLLLDLAISVLGCTVLTVSRRVHFSTVATVSFYTYTGSVLLFRCYIYAVRWDTWKDPLLATDFRGYGRGVVHLLQYYSTEVGRVTLILLTADAMWNLRSIVGAELPIEFDGQLEFFQDSKKAQPFQHWPIVSVVRVTRILLATMAICFVNRGHTSCLKCWLPIYLTAVVLEVVAMVTSFLENKKVACLSVYVTATLISFALSLTLVYYCTIFVYKPRKFGQFSEPVEA